MPSGAISSLTWRRFSRENGWPPMRLVVASMRTKETLLGPAWVDDQPGGVRNRGPGERSAAGVPDSDGLRRGGGPTNNERKAELRLRENQGGGLIGGIGHERVAVHAVGGDGVGGVSNSIAISVLARVVAPIVAGAAVVPEVVQSGVGGVGAVLEQRIALDAVAGAADLDAGTLENAVGPQPIAVGAGLQKDAISVADDLIALNGVGLRGVEIDPRE